jgi:hypothetical protein
MLQLSNNKTTRFSVSILPRSVIVYYLMIGTWNLVILFIMVGRAGLEPTTLCLKGRYSTV